MKSKKITLDEFRMAELRMYPHATGELSNLLRDIGLAGKRIHAQISMNGAKELQPAGENKNFSGEIVKSIDQFANDELLTVLKNSFSCAGVASEEEDGVLIFDNANDNNSQYIVMFDPIDGSANSDNCITVGSIFGIYRRITERGNSSSVLDFLQCGRSLAAAGYIIYGSSTMLVYATRRGVNGFTLDSSIGEFCLTHPGILCPKEGRTYSLNESNLLRYNDAVIRYVRGVQQRNVVYPGSFTSRYVGSMVADLHRTLMEGGIFLYPETDSETAGKLRLMYECNPFAFIFEIANGQAIDGYRNILDIKPTVIHQRTPFIAGSKQMVQDLQRIYRYERKSFTNLFQS